ncbi:MAG TPA: hypothetical protein VHU41_10335 [Thermoanaerobaculia bacterium]|jgi:hypothetical protein|nr:hypothetical protein [Thermoanaerobaculia bacterium]
MKHIHNGDVVAEQARREGLPGEHISFREALATGPGTRDLETRAQFIAGSHDEKLLRVRNDFIEMERALEEAKDADEVVLWFEHDLFCLINLLSLLDRFAACRRLTLVWHPEPLSQVELYPLFESRAAVTPRMLALARDAWAAYLSEDPRALNRFVRDDNRDFPFLREGLTLHAARFPSTRNGLGGVEQRILDLVLNGSRDFMTLFYDFDAAPPRYGLGDMEILRVLRVLAHLAVPLLTMTEENMPQKSILTLTPAAENVLRGEVDYVTVNEPDYWLGGVHLTRDNVWRWDERKREIVSSRSAG